MAAKIIAFSNSKGGVGKTTTCISVGCCLAEINNKVLLIDLDHQSNLSDDLGRSDEDYTITDLFENPKMDIRKLIYQAKNKEQDIPNLNIIPADITLAIEARSAERFRHRLSILEDGLKNIINEYDFILMDLRPAIDLSIENALLITDLIVIPVDMDRRAIKGIDDLLTVIAEVKRNNNFVYTLLKTKVNKSHSKMIESINKKIKDKNYPVMKSTIRSSELYKQASDLHLPATLYSLTGKPRKDYIDMTKELLDMIKD